MLAPQLDSLQKKICIQACLDAQHACETTALHLYSIALQSNTMQMRLLLDCAALCQAHADFMRGDSDLQQRFGAACIQICLQCAQECRRFGNDIQMKLCASACLRCAESCQQIIRKPIDVCSVPLQLAGVGVDGAAQSSRSI